MNLYAMYSLASFVAALVLGLVVYFHNPRNRLNRMYLFLGLALAGWSFVEFGYRQSITYREALFWNRLDLFWVIAAPLALHVVFLFTERRRILANRWTGVVLYGPAILFGFADLTTGLITGPPVREYWGWTYRIQPLNPLSGLTMLWALSVGIASIVMLVIYHREQRDPIVRRGTVLVIAGTCITVAAAMISENHLIVSGLHIPHTTIEAFTLSSLLFGIAIWKYKPFIIMPGSMAETVFEAMADGLVLLTMDYRIVQANRSAAGMLGVDAGDLVGTRFYSYVAPEHGAYRLPPLPGAGESDEAHICDTAVSIKRADGGTFPATIDIVPLPSGRTWKQGRLCVMRDMTERCEVERRLRQYQEQLEDIVVERTRELLKANRLLTLEVAEHTVTEAELARSRSRLREIVDMVPEIVYELDDKGMVVYANKQSFLMTGYRQEDLDAGFFSLDLLAPEDRTRAGENIECILGGATVTASEFTILRKDGTRMPVLSRIAPIWRNGSITGVRGIFVDITEKKKAEQELSNYERRFRDMLENINLIALMVDAGGIITFCNDFLLNLTGWNRPGLIGKSVIDVLIVPEHRERVRERFFSGNMPMHTEGEILTRSGCRRLVTWSHTVLRDPQGTILGMSSIGDDITDRRTLERQYHQAQKMESVGRLAGGIAHDFNNLLTIILGNAEIGILTVEDRQSAQGCLQEIKRTASRAADLTQQLLAFSRYQLTEPKITNLNHILFNMDKMLRRLIGEDIELVVLPDERLSTVKIDPGQFSQVITNLVVNARDAMPDGGVLTIRTVNRTIPAADSQNEPAPGEYVCVSATDTGTGMEAEVMRHLFEPFFTTKELGKGTGLGLATCYGIVKQNNGFIDVASEVGRGTTIEVYLPRVCEDPVHTCPPPDEQADMEGTESVLLVEDEVGLGHTLSQMLARNGYHVTCASNGDEALRIVTQSGLDAFDLVITDVVMPRMGGRELIIRLRELNPCIQVLYMSGYTDTNLVAEDLEYPGCEFIQKPFTTTTFIRKIRTLLDSVADTGAEAL